MATVTLPSLTGSVSQQFIIEPLGGPQDIAYYLDRFPDEAYNLSVNSHLYKFLYTLLGNQGVNWIKKNYLEARLYLEELGLQSFDLDSFFGDPFSFGRILDESYDQDPYNLLPKATADLLRAKDAAYRNRALDFVNGARAGNTVLGMRLVAKSGLGHEVDIIENYKYLYDNHSDDPMGLPYYGKTMLASELIVVPRREISRNEVQRIEFVRNPDLAVDGSFFLTFRGEQTDPLPFTISNHDLMLALTAVPQIGADNVVVTGGPSSDTPSEGRWTWDVSFQNALAGTDVPELVPTFISNDPAATMSVTTVTGGHEAVDDAVVLSDRERYDLQSAIDRTRPVTGIVTVFGSPRTGRVSRTNWTSSFASSEYTQVIRYVTGNPLVKWPERDGAHWIESNTEREAPLFPNDLQHHYKSFHDVGSITASSQHIGQFTVQQIRAMPFLGEATSVTDLCAADRALADYPEPLLVTSTQEVDGVPVPLLNGVYPIDYQGLSGVPQIKYKGDQFWASTEGTGTEYLEIDLGSPRAVNLLHFEITNKPVTVQLEYDLLDLDPDREWQAVSPIGDYENAVMATGDPNPWSTIELSFANGKGEMIFTRFIRISFIRRAGFITDDMGNELPWSVEVRNLRIGRSVA